MRQTLIACLIFILVATVCGQRGNATRDRICKQFNKKIQIFRPRGLTVSQRARENLLSFEIAVYVNQQHNERLACDICANATINYGKSNQLVIDHSSIVVLPGDRFQYSVIERYRYGPPRLFSCEFTVSDRLKFVPAVKSDTKAPLPTLARNQPDALANKMLLEELINDIIDGCKRSDITNFLAVTTDENVENSSKMIPYLLERLNTLVPTLNWGNMLSNAYHSKGMLVFDAQSALMKKKVLHLIRGTDAANKIVDYDRLNRSSYDTDDSFYDDY
ncbi:uncharacterized protein LOC128727881 [Anopheles nili]|uniref:uncharacterized protein LOC128727881 n=1 Tax=Anopheles nili TaxID=185578 RepID=UPI00237ACC5C|nr:uncharacterized protein LOC128727881 [Anopheles nili]